MTKLIPFAFDSNAVRTVMLEDQPWFVGKDVALALGYVRPNDALQQHCKGAVKRRPLETAGGTQEVRLISEPDVLRLIISSRLPEAQRFERWVFEEVLPALRRHGQYQTATAQAVESKALSGIVVALSRSIRAEVKTEIQRVVRQQSLSPLVLENIAAGQEWDPAPAKAFWQAIAACTKAGARLDHSCKSNVVSYNLPQVRLVAQAHGHHLPSNHTLHRALRHDPLFVAARTIRSSLAPNKTIHCVVFRRKVPAPA